MKKRMILMAIAAMMVLSATAQVEITKFKFKRDEPFGMFPGRKMIDMKFKNTSDRPMKYLKVYYYAVNAVGDVVSGRDRGVLTEGRENYIKPMLLDCMGPFEPGKSYSRWASGVIQTKQKGTLAVPYEVEIIYMQNDTTRIKIDGSNLKQFFPKNEWRDYNRRNQQL